LIVRFPNTGFKDILSFIANATGINISYDRDVVDRATSVELNGVSLEQALNTIMTMNQLSYKVVNQTSIFVFPDTVAKHTQYDEQVIKTFFIQHADAQELIQILSTVIRIPNMAIQPAIVGNKTNNTITARASTSVMQILEKIIEQNDKPRAEIVFDVEILEVDRDRAKSYGLDLTQFSLGAIFSPEVSPSSTTTTPPGAGQNGAAGGATQTTPPESVTSPPPFNLNTISRGVSTADFYLAVPAAVVRFLESDTRSRLLAKPQLRGTEGTKLTLNLGQEVPIVTTSYTPIATGGVGVNPLNSFQLRPVGINLDITPRVTLDGDILIDLNVESSATGPDKNVAGTNYPSFVTRKVGTRLRLRDGEPNLLAGLLREDETSSVSGFPGAVRVPFLRQVFSKNQQSRSQIDLIMLLTPHIVRTNEVTESDLRPIYIGSQQNLGVGGPPPLIAPPAEPEPPAAPAPPPPAPAPKSPAETPGAPSSRSLTPPGTIPPPGSTPIPGVVAVPPPTAAPAAPATPAPSPPVPAQPAPAPETAPEKPAPSRPPEAPATAPGVGLAQVIVTPPATPFRVGQGPYTVPVSIVGAARLSTITLTLTYDPAVLRVRTVQEGSFMRSGGADATFVQQVSPGRVDVTITRSDDATGASGTGPLAAVVFDAVAPGMSALTVNGAATGPGGAVMGLQFRPATITVQ
jgi:general secretion pathway protein D